MATAETLTKFRDKLVKSIDELRSKRDSLSSEIEKEEKEKAQIEQSLPGLSIKLSKSVEILSIRKQFLADIDSSIADIEKKRQTIKEGADKYELTVKKEKEYEAKKKK